MDDTNITQVPSRISSRFLRRWFIASVAATVLVLGLTECRSLTTPRQAPPRAAAPRAGGASGGFASPPDLAPAAPPQLRDGTAGCTSHPSLLPEGTASTATAADGFTTYAGSFDSQVVWQFDYPIDWVVDEQSDAVKVDHLTDGDFVEVFIRTADAPDGVCLDDLTPQVKAVMENEAPGIRVGKIDKARIAGVEARHFHATIAIDGVQGDGDMWLFLAGGKAYIVALLAQQGSDPATVADGQRIVDSLQLHQATV